MNGPHDMGGMQCYGRVLPEVDEPVFHHDWERRALAITVAGGACGRWNLDISRHTRESLPPVQYLTSSYYEIWIAGLEQLMLDAGMVTPEELSSGCVGETPVTLEDVPDGVMMRRLLAKGSPVMREPKASAKFRVGDAVRTRNLHPAGHTRLPRYARDKDGVVEAVVGCHVFPDSHAHGLGEDPHWLYMLRFDARVLFGADADHSVCVDCWEPYIETR